MPKSDLKNLDLSKAKTAIEYGDIWKKLYNKFPDIYPFNNKFYCIEKKKYTDKDGNNRFRYRPKEVSDFVLKPLYYEYEENENMKPINKLVIEITPFLGIKSKIKLSPSNFMSSDLTAKVLSDRARVSWYGNKEQTQSLDRWIKEHSPLNQTNGNGKPNKYHAIPSVKQLEDTGYHHESNHYIFKNYAINPKGDFLEISLFDAIQVSKKKFIKPANDNIVKPSSIKNKSRFFELYDLISNTWPTHNNGSIALSWVVASWFVNQVKPKTGFFPFLSLWGDTQTGKTQLVRLLNSLQGEYGHEGIPMNKFNTMKGPIRIIAKRSGIFTAMLETQAKRTYKSFDFESILTTYNQGNDLQIRAKTDNTKATKKIPFYGSLLFAQNVEPFTTRAQKERVISLNFEHKDINTKTSMNLNFLKEYKPEDLSSFMCFILQNRKYFEEKWEKIFIKEKEEFYGILKDYRISENFALINTFHVLLRKLLNFSNGIKNDLIYYAEEKLIQTNAKYSTRGDYFFELLFEVLEMEDSNNTLANNEMFEGLSSEDWFRYSEGQNRIYIHMVNAIKAIKVCQLDLKTYDIDVLYNSLRSHQAYLKEQVSTRMNGVIKKAWVFRMDTIKEIVQGGKSENSKIKKN